MAEGHQYFGPSIVSSSVSSNGIETSARSTPMPAAASVAFFTDAPEPGEHHYVVRAQSIAGELPVGPLVAYSSPTYVRSDSAGGGSV